MEIFLSPNGRLKRLPKPSLGAKFAYYCFPFRRKTVLENLGRVFGKELSAGEIKELAQNFYGHLGLLLFENLNTIWMSREEISRRVRVVGHEIVVRAAEEKRGVLLLTGHFGNWEITPIGVALQFDGFRGRFHVVRKLLANKFFEKILFRRFYQVGLDVIPKKNALSHVINALEKNDVVAFIMDQYARPDKDGILADFFGHPAGTYKSLALIAKKTGAVVIPVRCYREAKGKHVMEFYEPLHWKEDPDPDQELYKNTLQYNHKLESMILENPEQWLWCHRRWKVK